MDYCKKEKLNYRFHDSAIVIEYISKVFIKANQKNVEVVIREKRDDCIPQIIYNAISNIS